MSEDIAVIGIKLPTDDIERGAAALDTLASKGDKVDAALGKIEGAGASAGKSLATLGQTSGLDGVARSGASAADGMGKLGQASTRATDAIAATAGASGQASAAMLGIGSAAKSATQGVSDHIRKLQEQADTFGLSERKAQAYKLAMEGATRAQIDQADALKKHIQELERGAEIGANVGAAIKAGMLLAVAGVGAAAVAFEKLIGNVAKYQDLAEQTGGDPAGLASLRTAADVGGTSVESMTLAANRMQQMLSKVSDESKGAGKALGAIGIEVEKFKSLKADEQLRELGKALNEYADGGGKVAVIQGIMGRGAASLLPALKELGNETEKQNGLTNEQIKLADDYKDAQARTRSELLQLAEVLAVPLLPVMTSFIGAMKESVAQMAGVGDGANSLRGNTALVDFAKAGSIMLAELIDNITRTGSLLLALKGSLNVIAADVRTAFNFATAGVSALLPGFIFDKQNADLKKSLDDREKTLKDANERYAKIGSAGLAENLKGKFAQQDIAATFGIKNTEDGWLDKKRLNPDLANTPKPKSNKAAERAAEREAREAAKAAYEALISDQKQYADESKFIYDQMMKDIDSAHKRGIVSEYDYISAKNAAALEGLTNQQSIVEKEIAIAKSSGLQPKEKIKAVEAFQKALTDLNQAQTALSADLIRQEDQLNDKLADAMDKRLEMVKKATQGLIDEQKGLRQEREEFGLTEKQLNALKIARADEMAVALERKAVTQETIDLSGAESTELRRQAELIRSNARLRVENTGVKEMQAQWKAFYADIERGLTDSLYRAFESGKGFFQTLWDGIKNLFKTTVLKLVIQGTVGSVLGSGYGNAAGGAIGGSGGGILGIANNLSSMNSLYGAGVQAFTGGSVGASAASLGYANAVGAVGGDALGALAAANGSWSGIAASATAAETATAAMAANTALAAGEGAALAAGTGATAAGGAATAGLAAIPVYGWIALAALAAYAVFSKESKPSSSTGDAAMAFDINGKVVEKVDNAMASYKAFDNPAYDKIVIGLQADYAKTAKALGIIAVNTGFGFAGSTGEGGEKPNISIIGRGGASVYQSGETERTDANMQLLASRAVFAALKGSELPKYLAGLFDSLNPGTMAQEEIGKVLEYAKALKSFNDQLLKMPFKGLADLSFAATQGLIAAAGGLDKLGTGIASYYSNFYTEAEKTANTSQQIADALSSVNIAMPKTRDEFRKQFEAATALGDAGTPVIATLLSVESAFASIVPAAKDAAQATQQSADAMAQAAARMKSQISGLAADYLNSKDLRNFRAGEIQGTLAGGGINLSIEQILSASRNDALALFKSYEGNSAAQQAILDAGRAFADLTPVLAQAQQVYADSGGGSGALTSAVSAQTQATDALIATMKDLNSSLLNTGIDSFARLQAQFEKDIERARTGDLAALQELPGLAKALVEAGKNNSTSAVEQAVLTGQVIESLGSVVASPNVGRASDGVNRDAQLELMKKQFEAMQLTLAVIARNTGKAAVSLDGAANGSTPFGTIAMT